MFLTVSSGKPWLVIYTNPIDLSDARIALETRCLSELSMNDEKSTVLIPCSTFCGGMIEVKLDR